MVRRGSLKSQCKYNEKAMNLDKITQDQRNHWKSMAYSNAGSVAAVGSESLAHKHLRYEKLLALIPDKNNFTLHEVGPGVCDFYGYLKSSYPNASSIVYSASEITSEYCDIARKTYPGIEIYNRDILSGGAADEKYDYLILSGVFHQLGNASHRHWIEYMQELLLTAWGLTNKALVFNVLTSYADFYKPGNFYANLTELQCYVVRRLSRFLKMDCSYPLFEATISVFRSEFIEKKYSDSDSLWSKYLKE